ncbi:MAG: hypothetical protein WA892_11640 [Ornithinimicrobium sp.]
MSSTGHGPRREDPEADPTGVRELLSSLPDPGPMPDHVAARIAASLDEQARRQAGQPVPPAADRAVTPVVGGPPRAAGRPVLDLDRQPARPRPAQWLSAVAAVAAVVAVGVVGTVVYQQLVGLGTPSNASAQYVPAGEEVVEVLPPVSSQAAEGNVTPEQETVAAPQEAGTAEGAVSRMDDRTFAAGAEAVLDRAEGRTSSGSIPSAFEVPADAGAPLSPPQTKSCVRSTGESPTGSGWVAATVRVAQADVVVVSDRDASNPRAWAVSADCVADASAPVLHGPTDLP